MPHLLALAFFFFLTAQLGPAQPAAASVSIQVHVDQSEGAVAPVWNYFGYDEPNYTYASNGKRLLDELAAALASAQPRPAEPTPAEPQPAEPRQAEPRQAEPRP